MLANEIRQVSCKLGDQKFHLYLELPRDFS